MVRVEHDVVYNEQYNLKTDLYYPDDNMPVKGAVIDLHGGGWFRGDKAKDADIATEFAEDGFFVAVPNYRYTPEVYFPVPIKDVVDIVTWLEDVKKIDQNKIVTFGSSAGGNLAVELAIKMGIPAVSWSGILDIDDWILNHREVKAEFDQTQDFNNSASATINQTGANDSFYKWFVMNYLQNKEELLQPATPWRRIGEKTGPMFLANSLNEFVPTSGVMLTGQKLLDNQIPVEMHFLSGTQHAKGYHDLVIKQTLAFINQHVGK